MDNKLTLAVKELAYSLGADLVGVANIERFENAPIRMSPQGILPCAKSVIVCAVHHPDAAIELDGEIHPQDMAFILNKEGVSVRVGHHCAAPLVRRMGEGVKECMVYLPAYAHFKSLEIGVDKGEKVSVAVKSVSNTNYAVYLKDARGNYYKELTLTMDKNTELSVVVMENPLLQQYKIQKGSASSSVKNSSVWKTEFLIDGERFG